MLQRNRYVKTPARGSVVLEATGVLRLAYRGIWSEFTNLFYSYSIYMVPGLNPVQTWKNFRSGPNWDAARPAIGDNGMKDFAASKKIITWDSLFVDEIRRTLFACKVL